MQIHVGQIYISPDAAFPFSVRWQTHCGDLLSSLPLHSARFEQDYGVDYKLIFRVSAKKNIDEVETRGPTHFRRDRHVEFTLFLPHAGRARVSVAECRVAMDQMFAAVGTVLELLGCEPEALRAAAPRWIDEIMNRAEMFGR